MNASDRPALGISLRVLSGVLMAGMFICVKAISQDVPLGQIVFFRSFFAIIPLIVFLWLRREFPQGLATKRPGAHFLRASFGALALFTSFAAVARLNLAEAILLAQLSPILVAIGAVAFLSERLTIWRIIGLFFGFSGVVVLVWPELHVTSAQNGRITGYVLGLLSAALSALALIMVRSLNRTESPGAIALYFVLASMIGAIATFPWGWIMPDAKTLTFLVFSGVFGGFAHISMTLAFRYAEASRLAPFEYLALFWPVLADIFVFETALTYSFLIAAPLLLIGTGVAAAERRQKADKDCSSEDQWQMLTKNRIAK